MKDSVKIDLILKYFSYLDLTYRSVDYFKNKSKHLDLLICMPIRTWCIRESVSCTSNICVFSFKPIDVYGLFVKKIVLSDEGLKVEMYLFLPLEGEGEGDS